MSRFDGGRSPGHHEHPRFPSNLLCLVLSPVLHPVTVFCLKLFSLPACSFIEFLTPDVVFLKFLRKGAWIPFELLYQDRFTGNIRSGVLSKNSCGIQQVPWRTRATKEMQSPENRILLTIGKKCKQREDGSVIFCQPGAFPHVHCSIRFR